MTTIYKTAGKKGTRICRVPCTTALTNKSTNKRMRTLRSDLGVLSSEMAREGAVAVSSELEPVPEDASDLEPQAPMETTE